MVLRHSVSSTSTTSLNWPLWVISALRSQKKNGSPIWYLNLPGAGIVLNWISDPIYLKSHGGARLDIPKLEEACSHVSVAVEEPPELVLELWELLFVGVALIILAVVVQHVDRFLVEELGDFGVVIHHLPQVGLLEVGVKGLIPHACVPQHRWQNGPGLEAQAQVPELEEEDGCGGQHILLEGVRQPVTALNLLELGQSSQKTILESRPEQRAGQGSILRFVNLSLLVIILWVGVVRVLPLVLPPQVVWIAAVPDNLVEPDQPRQPLTHRSCDDIHQYKYYGQAHHPIIQHKSNTNPLKKQHFQLLSEIKTRLWPAIFVRINYYFWIITHMSRRSERIRRVQQQQNQNQQPITSQTNQQPTNETRELTQSSRPNVQRMNPVQIALPPKPTLYIPSQLIGKVDMRTFFTENPSLNTFAEAIERTLENKAQVKRLLFAFLSNRKNTLWSVKYSPKGLNGIYSWATVKEVKTWLEKFSQTVREAQEEDQEQSSAYQSAKQKQSERYLKKVIVLYGREGLGKLTLLRSLASTIGMEPHVLTNKQDQIKYIKEKQESIKSRCIKNTQNKLQKNLQIVQQIDFTRSQKGWNFNLQPRFVKFIQKSMVPFVLTSNAVEQIQFANKAIEKIEFQQPKNDQLAELFWTIFHIEHNLFNKFSNLGIEADQLNKTLRSEFEQLSFSEVIQKNHFEDLVHILDYKYERIFNFLHFHLILNIYDPQVLKRNALLMMISHAENITEKDIVRNVPVQLSYHKKSNQRATSQELQDRLGYLNKVIVNDLLQHALNQNAINRFSHKNWIQNLQADLAVSDLCQHYPISHHRHLTTQIANTLNRQQISSGAGYSSLKPCQFSLISPKKNRNSHQSTRTLLQASIGVAYTRYLLHYARIN